MARRPRRCCWHLDPFCLFAVFTETVLSVILSDSPVESYASSCLPSIYPLSYHQNPILSGASVCPVKVSALDSLGCQGRP